MGRFILKHIDNRKPQLKCFQEAGNGLKSNNNKQDIKEQVMTTNEKIAMAQDVLQDAAQVQVKRVKKDKGLIERMESTKTILTEDNKELLRD